MYKYIILISSFFIISMAFQNCSEVKTNEVQLGKFKFVNKISSVVKIQHGMEVDRLVDVDLMTNQYSISENQQIIETLELPAATRTRLGELLADGEICQLIPQPNYACTMQLRPSTVLFDSQQNATVLNWNSCQSHKYLCTDVNYEINSLLNGLLEGVDP